MTDQHLQWDDKQRICDALLKIRAMQDVDLRNLYVSELESHIGHSLTVQRYPEARHDLWSVVSACASYPGALWAFVEIVRGFQGDSVAILELERIVRDLERRSPLAGVDRDALVRMTARVEISVVVATFHDVTESPASPQQQPNWHDMASVVRRLESMPAAEDGVPPLLIFVDRLAHQVEGTGSIELHRWIDRVGSGLGFGQAALRQLCVETRHRLDERRPVVEGEENLPALPEMPNMYHKSVISGESSSTAGVTVISSLTPLQPALTLTEQREPVRIWGGVPIRNPDFTGREAMMLALQRALEAKSKASVLPQTLHGLGGVGKTQLAVEYVYRYGDRYDLVWWIPAEQQSLVLASLAELGRRLAVPESEDRKQTAGIVLDALASSGLRWLLVFDNADQPEDIAPLVPSAGGHVILTSRNQAWANVWDAIEVDVFDRQESVELILKRGQDISEFDADRLAAKMGDLPLALDQAASWQAATGMPVAEYLTLFDEHVRELLSEGKPTAYPMTIAAFVSLAFERLRAEAPAVAQLLELFAFLGAEPVSVALLRLGREADISQPLSRALREPIYLNRTIRDLRRYGLAKVDPNQRIQVHRLVQLVLREGLSDELATQSRRNVHNLLASANPGDPDHPDNGKVHAEIGPHVMPGGFIEADTLEARRVALDQIRYRFVTGNYEGARRIGEVAVEKWRNAEGEGLGPNGELTLIATRHLASALRALGFYDRARQIEDEAFRRLSEHFGELHEHTLMTGIGVGVGLRVAGDFRSALALDEANLDRHRHVFGNEDPATLRAKSVVAVSLRMLGDFRAALALDEELVQEWEQTVGENDQRTLFNVANVARDLYGLGRYAEALELQAKTWPLYRDQLGARHSYVLLAARTIAIALRKTGNYAEALSQSRENYRSFNNRFGPDHEHTLAATMSYANTLRVIGELSEARGLATDAVGRYRRNFGERHPLALAAAINLAIILRALGELREARALDTTTYEAMRDILGADHGYTLCAANNLANDLVLEHDLAAARRLSEETLTRSHLVRGDTHPYTLACATNAAFDLQAVGEETTGQALLDKTIAELRNALGPDHPETIDAARGKRAECDIEPPPT